MHTALKWGLGAAGAWAVLALMSKAAEPPKVAAGPDPLAKPLDPPKPTPPKPGPSDGKTPPAAPPSDHYLREMPQSSKAAVYKVFDNHDGLPTVRANIIDVSPEVTDTGMGRLNAQIKQKLDASPGTSVLLLTGESGAMVWIATYSEVAAQNADPKNEWVLYLRPGEYDAVKQAAYSFDPSSIPVQTALTFGKILRGFATAS